jgi:hypothetical protein
MNASPDPQSYRTVSIKAKDERMIAIRFSFANCKDGLKRLFLT